MIAKIKIKNRHLRRLAIIGWSLLCLAFLPFPAILQVAESTARFFVFYLSEWWYTAHKIWNQP